MKKHLITIFLLLLVMPGFASAQETAPLAEMNQKVKQELDQIHELAGRGKLDEAIGRMQTLLKDTAPEGNPLKLQYDLANLYFLQGRYREARAAYQRFLMSVEDQNEMVVRAQERIAKMKEREAKRKDEVAIRLIDIETALDVGQIPPPGSKDFLRKVAGDITSMHQESASRLFQRIIDLENQEARKLLNTARQLFDVEKNYPEVIVILETIQREFPETQELPSVKILLAETERRMKRRLSPLAPGG